MPVALLNWTDDEVREEYESDVFQSYGAQDPPKIGTERVVDALDGGKRKHVGPHDAYGEERHRRFHERSMRKPTAQDDKTEMGELSRGIGEAKDAPVPCQYAKARPEQCRHRSTGVGGPKEKKRQAPRQTQRDAQPVVARPQDHEDHNGQTESCTERSGHPEPDTGFARLPVSPF